MIVLAALFVTSEYRRGLIRTTLVASPRRGRVLAAKAVVAGSMAFAAGAVATAIAEVITRHVFAANGNYLFPQSGPALARVVIGTGLFLGLAAALVVALGTMLRRSAGAVVAGLVLLVLPGILGLRWLRHLADAVHPDRGLRHPSHPAPLRPSHQRLHASERLLPDQPLGRPRRARRLHRGGHGRSHVASPPSRRLNAAAAFTTKHMRDALHAEWTKLRTLASTCWLFIGTVVLTVAVSATVATTTHDTSGSGQDLTKLSLTGVYLGQTVIAVLAVLIISEEYGNGMIRATLTAMPRRLLLLSAKATNVAGLAFVSGLVAIAGCLVAGRIMLPNAGFNPAHGYALVSIAHGPTLRAAAGSVIYLVLIALLSLGVATAIRDTAVSIGAVLGLLYLPQLVAQVVNEPLRRHIQQIAPMTAGLVIQSTTNLRSLPIAPWAGLGVLAAWGVTSLLIGGLLLRLRDA